MKLKYMLAAWVLAVVGTGCDDKLDEFEKQEGFTGVPATIEQVSSEALPGQIQLNWTLPAGDFTYMKIWYEDPLKKETVYNIMTKGTTSLLVDETRARFGEYEFFFQTFNSNHEGGEIKSFKAVSGAAPVSYKLVGRSQIALTGDMVSTNAQEPKEGPVKNVVDGNLGNFYHSPWSYSQAYPQWIQVDLNEPHENFIVGYVNRNNSDTTNGRPSVVNLDISSDGENWETVGVLSGLPSAASSEYTSDYFMPGKTFTHFRFNVQSSTGSKSYWNIAELYLYDAQVEIYDPETVELD